MEPFHLIRCGAALRPDPAMLWNTTLCGWQKCLSLQPFLHALYIHLTLVVSSSVPANPCVAVLLFSQCTSLCNSHGTELRTPRCPACVWSVWVKPRFTQSEVHRGVVFVENNSELFFLISIWNRNLVLPTWHNWRSLLDEKRKICKNLPVQISFIRYTMTENLS